MTATSLAAGPLRVVIEPEIGGSVIAFDHGGIPLLRPWDGSPDPASTASFPLLPWSGRISGGGFHHAGRFHPLAANWPVDPHPIHGDAWQRPWRIDAQDARAVQLVLDPGGMGPWRYRAELDYRLDEASLSMELGVEHLGDADMPYGVGFHPWFPRAAGMSLRAGATDVWLEDERYLPTERVPLVSCPDWDFRAGRPLPDRWINNVFEGWDGEAELHWPDRQLSLRVQATPVLDRFLVYSPGSEADFFCFEPISHPVDAFHLPGTPGLRLLAPGGRLKAGCRLTVAAT